MTRDELRSLGHTDAQLDGWYVTYFGAGWKKLAEEREDTMLVQDRRERAFRLVMQQWQGVHRDPNLPKIGAFAEDDASVHETFRTGES